MYYASQFNHLSRLVPFAPLSFLLSLFIWMVHYDKDHKPGGLWNESCNRVSVPLLTFPHIHKAATWGLLLTKAGQCNHGNTASKCQFHSSNHGQTRTLQDNCVLSPQQQGPHARSYSNTEAQSFPFFLWVFSGVTTTDDPWCFLTFYQHHLLASTWGKDNMADVIQFGRSQNNVIIYFRLSAKCHWKAFPKESKEKKFLYKSFRGHTSFYSK